MLKQKVKETKANKSDENVEEVQGLTELIQHKLMSKKNKGVLMTEDAKMVAQYASQKMNELKAMQDSLRSKEKDLKQKQDIIDSLISSSTKEQQNNSITQVLRQIEDKNDHIQKLSVQLKSLENSGEKTKKSNELVLAQN